MIFSDEAPGASRRRPTPARAAAPRTVATGAYKGTSVLFQRLLGFTPRCAIPTNTTICNDHASKPYFTADDVTDWTWVTITPKASAADRTPVIQPYDLPALRAATTLTLSLPRVGFYTTPAFLALWNTNDSNQHRVTANQTLLVALGQAFTARELDHAVLSRPASTPATRSRAPSASAATRRWIRCASSGRTSSTSTTATTSRRPAATTRATRGRRGTLVDEFAFGDVNGDRLQHRGPRRLPRAGDRRRRPAPLRHRGRAAALLLRELVAVQRERRRVPPRRRRVQGQHLQLRGAGRRSSSRRRSSPARPRPAPTAGGRGPGQHRAARPPLRGAVQPPRQARHLRAGGRASQLARRPRPPASRPASPPTPSAAAPSRRSRRRSRRCSIARPPRCCARTSRRRSSTRPSGAVYTSADIPGAINAMVETVMGYPPSHPLHAQAAQILMDHQVARARAGRERIDRDARQPSACGRRSRWPANRPAPSGIGL